PVEDSVALATALECVANDPGLRKRLGEAGRLEVRRFELPLTLAAWDEIIAP
ncbi:MAG: glycosyltransferase family 4 protein, partial [Planctomycetes bacterium]|nr:glycosyltransferase family 4 protein [Planctomycetota bacterium]